LGARNGDFVFFLPAGVRPVKGILEWLRAMEEVHRLRPQVKVALAGPILDEGYANAVLLEVDRLRGFATYLGTIPASSMLAAYGGADVVVNSSVSEGLSNALLEAISMGVPVLASDVPGNRYVVLGTQGLGPCGLLYNREDPRDLCSKALALIDDHGLRLRLSSNGRQRSSWEFHPEQEAKLLLEVYRWVLLGAEGQGDPLPPPRAMPQDNP
jgi:glycosyltransferase involved in cell wall biosynthesis